MFFTPKEILSSIFAHSSHIGTICNTFFANDFFLRQLFQLLARIHDCHLIEVTVLKSIEFNAMISKGNDGVYGCLRIAVCHLLQLCFDFMTSMAMESLIAM